MVAVARLMGVCTVEGLVVVWVALMVVVNTARGKEEVRAAWMVVEALKVAAVVRPTVAVMARWMAVVAMVREKGVVAMAAAAAVKVTETMAAAAVRVAVALVRAAVAVKGRWKVAGRRNQWKG